MGYSETDDLTILKKHPQDTATAGIITHLKNVNPGRFHLFSEYRDSLEKLKEIKLEDDYILNYIVSRDSLLKLSCSSS